MRWLFGKRALYTEQGGEGEAAYGRETSVDSYTPGCLADGYLVQSLHNEDFFFLGHLHLFVRSRKRRREPRFETLAGLEDGWQT